ncbi:MAG TPA: ABC transporter permease subunit, partial [Chitinophagaceae bacterium]|nr:ABC transporter permease subunit [Chitinophagaceae bacterium]
MNAIQKQKIAFTAIRIMSWMVVAILITILSFIIWKGSGAISWNFISKMPSEGMLGGGIYPAIIGTLCLIGGSMLFAFPIGVCSGIYMNEYLNDGFLRRFIRLMTDNLAGVPSIVFGLFGMAFFVNRLHFGDSILAGSLTLGLLALPVIIRTTEEALKAID